VSDQAKPTVAFLGIGNMGAPMSSRLFGAGYPVTVWNRSPQRTSTLESHGVRRTGSPVEAVSGADLTILMLADGPAVSEVLFGGKVADQIRPGSIVIDMSSIPPALASEHAVWLATRGVHHLDAPVSGGTQGAAEGTLAIMVGGPPPVFETARPLLEVLGRPTLIGRSGSGQLAKLANQAIVAATIGAVAEALLLASAGGADPAKVREALTGGFADSVILRLHGERMLNRAWIPGGRMRTQVKDLRALLEFAASLNLTLPLSRKIAELFEATLEAGFGDYDHSALLLELERLNPEVCVGRKPDQVPGEAQ
jgi:2-hydroxy-3-oxopropionate reductase